MGSLVPCSSLALAGCSDDPAAGEEGGDDAPGRDTSDFISDDPAPAGGRGYDDDEGNGATGAAGEDGGDSDGGDDGEREISEADIIAVEGDVLYALSAYGGLSVVDISDPQNLTVLGRFRANSTPFEMYVEEGRVFLMLSDFGEYVWLEDEARHEFVYQSKLLALDATNPANIVVQGEFSLPGSIQDSRRVGEVLYVVTHHYGGCWGCTEDPRTTITSLDIGDRTAIERVDEIAFINTPSSDGYWSWSGQRSVSSTNERMYVAGTEYTGNEDSNSTIDVIDISDPGGVMQRGTSIPVAGQIQSRWQMDEHDGVLRVVSQPWQWQSDSPPIVETFAVESAEDIAPLGSLRMTLPRPESLQSVRFDGERGYAITFEQTDPLFTLDFSDPAEPRQLGELEIPGWVYHMEPRGDRLIGLGYDQGNPEGGINVSIFDVANMETPTMLSRVHFGGDWAYFAEDQNRIHKAMQLLDDEGLILIPFSGWEWDEGDVCSSGSTSGIQLIDWEPDALELRGLARGEGNVRRALMHRDRLFSVSDMAVQSYDISDRDAPASLDSSALAVNASALESDGQIVVRMSQDWWSNSMMLEVVPAQDPGTSDPLGRIDVREAVATQAGEEQCQYNYFSSDLVLHQGFAYLVRSEYYWYDYDGAAENTTRIDIVDVRDPATPAFVRSVELPFDRSYFRSSRNGFEQSETAYEIVGHYLVFHNETMNWNDSNESVSTAQLEVVDLVDPSHPVHVGTIDRGVAATHGGLQVAGNTVFSWQKRLLESDPSKVRYFLERFQVSDLGVTPMSTLNVPGVVVAYDEATQTALTVDHAAEAQMSSQEECRRDPAYFGYDDGRGCLVSRHELHQVGIAGDVVTVKSSMPLDGEDLRLRGVFAARNHVFVGVQQGSSYYGYYGYYGYGYGGDVSGESTVQVRVLPNWRHAPLAESGRVDIGRDVWLRSPVVAGDALLLGHHRGLAQVDAGDPAAPSFSIRETYGYGCYDIEMVGAQAACTLGVYGVQTFPVGG